ncbi:hypothetical protein PLICRDRAFT_203136 [Plicaturopsis crispa FD-325 SS-3]|nr:hypothetical protein PLICRDRAFT_203136 [Plicaturopsis crispa FD-325 SS-3]
MVLPGADCRVDVIPLGIRRPNSSTGFLVGSKTHPCLTDDCYHGSSREMPHSPPAADGMPSTLDLVQDFLLPRTSPPVPIRPPSPHYVFPDEIYQYDHTKPPTTDYGSRPFPSPTEKEALFNDPFLGSGARHHMPPYKPLRRNHFASKSSPLPFLYQSGLMRSRPVYRYAPVGQDSMQEHGFFRANVHRDTSAAYVRKVYPFAAEPAMHEQTYDTDEHPAKKKRKTTNSVLLNHSAETNKDHTTDLHGPARGFLSPPTFSTHPSEQVSEEESSFRIYKSLGDVGRYQYANDRAGPGRSIGKE